MLKLFRKTKKHVVRQFDIPQHSLAFPAREVDGKGNFYVHIHLPKTGGTTFNTILKKRFGDAYEPFEGRFIHHFPNLTNKQVSDFIKKHKGIKAASSHLFTAILPYQTAERKIVAIAFLRNPIDKFFSFYFHMRHRHGVDCLEKKYNLEDYVNYYYSTKTMLPGYLTHFVGEESLKAFEYVQELCLNGHLYLFSTNKMDIALSILNNKFPDDFYVLDFERENISKKDQSVTENMKNKVGAKISQFDWNLMDFMNNVKY